MGQVYRARDTRLGREVASKILPDHDADARQRLEREARTVSGLNHPHICVLDDIGREDGMDYLVMEYVEGETLEQRLTKGSTACSIMALTSASTETSVRMKLSDAPSRCANQSPLSVLRPAITTLAPSATKTRQCGHQCRMSRRL